MRCTVTGENIEVTRNDLLIKEYKGVVRGAFPVEVLAELVGRELVVQCPIKDHGQETQAGPDVSPELFGDPGLRRDIVLTAIDPDLVATQEDGRLTLAPFVDEVY